MVLSMDKWVGKVAVVTGASSGIGAAIVEELVEHGVKVIGLARRVELVEELANKLSNQKGELHALKVDISNTQEIVNVFKTIEEKFGAVHILVNNAGILLKSSLLDGDVEKWRKTFDTNVLGACTATKEAISIMRKHDVDGYVINMNSTLGHKIPPISFNVYPASKFAITALTETLKFELGTLNKKIRVTSISPGLVETEIFKTENFTLPGMSEMPIMVPRDIADTVIFVLSTPQHVQVEELIVNPTGTMM
ncbi:hypothetical protein HHI36_005835 [Cryptolaemus montrouzieri]|uniref:Farnesol dehydrogenase-like n=1 Tax=Cryptolaemus montrouzieri TaxID=559131 RepID=A0ABD2NVJ2_9CUCU